jgi:hypothetical protein
MAVGAQARRKWARPVLSKLQMLAAAQHLAVMIEGT